MSLILASTSPIRRQILTAAGVEFETEAPGVDESAFDDTPKRLACRLAEAKALAVSARRPGRWTIGSDSVVSVDGERFDKPRDRADAARHLERFSGRAMTLTSAVALARDGSVDWTFADTATLQLRRLSESFIESYLEAEWPAVSYCVGVFRMEGRGVQLFESIAGSHFTILGMPLLPLLGALRDRGMIPS